jgi:hypothetical protein
MITEEFDHYFRICLDRELSSKEARRIVLAISDVVPVVSDEEGVAMVYHLDEDQHCYDVNLESDVTADEGDQIFIALEKILPEDDFDCESSMDNMEEQTYLNRAVLEQLSKF